MIARGENDERFLLAPALKNIDLVFNEGFSCLFFPSCTLANIF